VSIKRNAREERDWAPVFCEHIAMGRTVTDACEAAGVSRQAAYLRRAEHGDFAAAWQSALEMRLERLQAAIYERATEGSIVHEEWDYGPKGEKRLIAQTRRTSDVLAMFEAKRWDPAYREKVQIEGNVSGEVVHRVSFLPSDVNPDDLPLDRRRAAAIALLGGGDLFGGDEPADVVE
jgi:hypothetical protein